MKRTFKQVFGIAGNKIADEIVFRFNISIMIAIQPSATTR